MELGAGQVNIPSRAEKIPSVLASHFPILQRERHITNTNASMKMKGLGIDLLISMGGESRCFISLPMRMDGEIMDSVMR